jgi:hypothetical protein
MKEAESKHSSKSSSISGDASPPTSEGGQAYFFAAADALFVGKGAIERESLHIHCEIL